MAIRNIALILMLSALGLPAGVHAETTAELIDRLNAESRKNNKWVPLTSCQAEQNAYRNGAADTLPADNPNSWAYNIAERLRTPWVYRYGGAVQGQEKSVAELQQDAVKYEGWASKEAASNPYGNLPAEYRLIACAYRVAANTKANMQRGSPALAASSSAGQCAPDAVASANRELLQIDQRLASFLNSTAGQQVGNSTPSLQAVMWGTKEQATVLMRHCPTSDAHKQRVADLMESHNKARQACRAVQTRPELCVPAVP